jgi:hypothetical protein
VTADIRNLAWLRSLKLDGHPEFGAKLFEALTDVRSGLDTLEQQTNSNLNGIPAAPPAPQSVKVTPTAVGHHVSINDGTDFYRGKYYHVESSEDRHFTNPFPEYSGPAREINLATGPRALHFRVFASYQNSDNSAVVYHGGAIPRPVIGGTAFKPGSSQGSGTGRPSQGFAGFGPTPWRGSKPPAR